MVCRALFAARSPPRLRRCRSVRPLLAGSGAAPHRCARAASERSRSGLSQAVASNCPATSGPTPNMALRVRAVRATAGRSRRSACTMSVFRASIRAAIAARAALVASPGSLRRVSSAVRAAQRATSWTPLRPARSSRRCCGAAASRPCSWLSAAVRALTAPRRATRSARIASTGPVRVFGVPDACSDTRWRGRRARRAGRTCPRPAGRGGPAGRPPRGPRRNCSDSGPGRRRRCRCPRHRPSPPTEAAQPRQQLPITGGRGGELLVAATFDQNSESGRAGRRRRAAASDVAPQRFTAGRRLSL